MKIRIGTKLHVVREERKLTQEEMADLLGLTTSTYARIERNETSVEFEKLPDFADALQVPIQDLLPETISITNNNHNPGPGGGVIFGNQNFYFGETESMKSFIKEITALKEEIERLKGKE
jgi:transcriptional regulator with XRE-family HTH domain